MRTAKEIEYKVGNLFECFPKNAVDGKNTQIGIVHICNSIGAWGSGFVVPLGMNFPMCRDAYLSAAKAAHFNLSLGECQIVDVLRKDAYALTVFNMIAQESIMSPSNPTPIKYEALTQCLQSVADFCKASSAERIEIWSPAFGSLRAGGKWSVIKELVQTILLPHVDRLVIFTLNESEQKAILTD